MKRILPSFAILLAVCAASAQVRPTVPSGAQTVVVLPFENRSQAPGLEWIGESFPEVLGRRLANSSLYMESREDRNEAFDQAGVPTNVHLSRETLYRIAEQMDADYTVLGWFNYDGQTFSADAQVLDMKHLRLSADLKEQGSLTDMMTVENALAWDVLHLIRPDMAGSKQAFVAAAPPVRLDAFENYIRGIVATSQPIKIKHLREAVRLAPDYVPAIAALGRTYFDGQDYEQAIPWLAKVPHDNSAAREANFYLGLAAFYQGQYDQAEAAFKFLASRLPLTEVLNDLGVVAARQGKPSEVDYFRQAAEADPNDADYHFNLAVALYKTGNSAEALSELRETLKLRPTDSEARSFLDTIAPNGVPHLQPTQAATSVHIPLERIKRNYDESSLQQLALEIENAAEARLANADPKTHAAYHVERGRALLDQGFLPEAERNFREAIRLDPTSAPAHAGLARVLELNNNAEGARAEAEAANHLQPSADALLVLARLDLKQDQAADAEKNVDSALRLDPANSAALQLKQAIAEKKK